MPTAVQSDTPIGWILAALVALHLFFALMAPAKAEGLAHAAFGLAGL